MSEESFYDLFEQYLDEEEIKSKKELDLEEKSEDIINTDSPFTIEDSITINDFVNNFLMIKCDASNLYHSGLKDLKCPYVVGVSNDFANKNPETVKQGFVLLVTDCLVTDCRKKRGTYVNPIYLRKILDKSDVEKEYQLFLKKSLNDLKKLEEFYSEYIILKDMVDTNKEFYKLLEEQRKLKKIKDIRRYEQMGGVQDGEHKRK